MWNEVINGLVVMFRDFDVVTHDQNQYAAFVFALGCGILGALAVLLDGMFYTIRKKSMLNLRHGIVTMVWLGAWSVASVIMGYLGQILNIFVVSVAASAVVGIAWPIIFIKAVESSNQKAEPEQT